MNPVRPLWHYVLIRKFETTCIETMPIIKKVCKVMNG